MSNLSLRVDEPASAARLTDELAEALIATRLATGAPESEVRAAVRGFTERANATGSWTTYRVGAGGRADVWDIPERGPLLVWLDVPAALGLVADACRDRGARQLALSTYPGPLDLAEAAQSLGGVLEATRMQLDLVPEPPRSTARLDAMTPDEFAAFEQRSIEEYADDLFATGGYSDRGAADAEALRQFADLLPEGLASPQQHLFTVRDGATAVGLLWLKLDGDWCFIYDIRMEEAARGQGHGTQAMHAGAAWARANGATVMGLNVFGANEGARRLYERLGYITTERFFHIDL